MGHKIKMFQVVLTDSTDAIVEYMSFDFDELSLMEKYIQDVLTLIRQHPITITIRRWDENGNRI